MKYVDDKNDLGLLKSFERFNRAVVKTNFYKEDVGAIGFIKVGLALIMISISNCEY